MDSEAASKALLMVFMINQARGERVCLLLYCAGGELPLPLHGYPWPYVTISVS